MEDHRVPRDQLLALQPVEREARGGQRIELG